MIIYRSGLTNPYKRLIFGLSMSDILQSFAIAFGPWLAPHDDEGSLWALGNIQTCELVGFFFAVGMTAVPMYTLSLCIYYVCKLRTRMADDYFAHRIERPLHIFIIVLNLVIYLMAVGVGAIDTLPFKNGCYLASRKGQIARGLIFFNSLIVPICCLTGIVLCMTMIFWHVMAREKIFGRSNASNQSALSGSDVGEGAYASSSWRLRSLRPRPLSSFSSVMSGMDGEPVRNMDPSSTDVPLSIDDRIAEDVLAGNQATTSSVSASVNISASDPASFSSALSSEEESQGVDATSITNTPEQDHGKQQLPCTLTSAKELHDDHLDPEGPSTSLPERSSLHRSDDGNDMSEVMLIPVSTSQNNAQCLTLPKDGEDPEIQIDSAQSQSMADEQSHELPKTKPRESSLVAMNGSNVTNSHGTSNASSNEILHPTNFTAPSNPTNAHHAMLQRNQEHIIRVYKRELVGQVCCYVLVFCVTALPFITQTFIFMSGNIPPRVMIWAMTFTFNLGGLFNILVYTRPNVASLRRRFPHCSRVRALYLVLRAGGEVPDISDLSPTWFSCCKWGNGRRMSANLARSGGLTMPLANVNISHQTAVSAVQYGMFDNQTESSLKSVAGMNGLSESFESGNAGFRPSKDWDYIEGEGSNLNAIEEEDEEESSSCSNSTDGGLSPGQDSSISQEDAGKKDEIDDDWAAAFDRVRAWKPSEG